MTIRFDPERRCALDQATGDYLVPEEWHYQSPTRDYSIYSSAGTKLLGATVRQSNIDRIGDGTANAVAVEIASVRLRMEDGSFMSLGDPSAEPAKRLAEFLLIWLSASAGIKRTVDIRFDALDGSNDQS